MKKLYKALPAVVFIVFIAVMLVLFLVLPKQKVSTSEKRVLQEMPALSADAFFSGTFQDGFESYISDHAPGRNFWVGVNAYAHRGMGQTVTGHATPENGYTRGIYQGSDGYLINEPQDMTGLMRNVGFIEECAAHLEVPVTVLIAPSTGYICEDKLPVPHYPYEDDAYFAQMADAFRAASFVDVRDAFKAAYADGRQLYYKTDHHWTACGAYTAYRALAGELGFTPLAESDYTVTAYPGFFGTTYSSSGFWLNEGDDLEVRESQANSSITVAITDNGTTTEQEGMFYYDHLSEDDKYPVYLDGNHPYTVIRNRAASSDERLLVVKDSFAHSLVPFLADHYAEIIMIDMRYYAEKTVPALVEEQGIDRVLFIYSIDNLVVDDRIAFIE